MDPTDPSTDLANVNAAYRVERDENDRLSRVVERYQREIGRAHGALCLGDAEQARTTLVAALWPTDVQNDNGVGLTTDPALPQGPEAHQQGAKESTCRVCVDHGATEGCYGCGKYKESETALLDVDAVYKAKMLGLLEALFTTHPEPESPTAARAVGRAINAAQHHLVQLERRAGIDGNV